MFDDKFDSEQESDSIDVWAAYEKYKKENKIDVWAAYEKYKKERELKAKDESEENPPELEDESEANPPELEDESEANPPELEDESEANPPEAEDLLDIKDSSEIENLPKVKRTKLSFLDRILLDRVFRPNKARDALEENSPESEDALETESYFSRFIQKLSVIDKTIKSQVKKDLVFIKFFLKTFFPKFSGSKKDFFLPIKSLPSAHYGMLSDLFHIDYEAVCYSDEENVYSSPFWFALIPSSISREKFLKKYPRYALCDEEELFILEEQVKYGKSCGCCSREKSDLYSQLRFLQGTNLFLLTNTKKGTDMMEVFHFDAPIGRFRKFEDELKMNCKSDIEFDCSLLSLKYSKLIKWFLKKNGYSSGYLAPPAPYDFFDRKFGFDYALYSDRSSGKIKCFLILKETCIDPEEFLRPYFHYYETVSKCYDKDKVQPTEKVFLLSNIKEDLDKMIFFIYSHEKRKFVTLDVPAE